MYHTYDILQHHAIQIKNIYSTNVYYNLSRSLWIFPHFDFSGRFGFALIDQVNQLNSFMTATHAIRHPWFSMPSTKRKLSPSSSSSSDNDDLDRFNRRSSPFRTCATKRRRYSVLERGFAQLAINHPILQTNVRASLYSSPSSLSPSSVVDLDLPVARSPSATPMDLEDTYPTVHPASVEEPTSPDVPLSETDVTMRSRSWYELEKDRIVITDLDDSDDESDTESAKGIDISTALLERIKDRPTNPILPVPIPSTSTALVLFRPLFSPREVKDEPAEEVAQSYPPININDAMDIEP